jgi:hypothetical protein
MANFATLRTLNFFSCKVCLLEFFTEHTTQKFWINKINKTLTTCIPVKLRWSLSPKSGCMLESGAQKLDMQQESHCARVI